MSDLDEKLDVIFREDIDDAGNTNVIKLTDDVKQAFIDAGWTPSPLEAIKGTQIYKMTTAEPSDVEYDPAPESRYGEPVEVPVIEWPPKSVLPLMEAYGKYKEAGGPDDWVIISRDNWETNAKLSGFMSGPEWYERFEKELATYDWSTDERHSILVAARRASGVEE